MYVDLVKRAIEGEHRILIFSQFTSMFSLSEQDLTREGIGFKSHITINVVWDFFVDKEKVICYLKRVIYYIKGEEHEY